MKTKPKKKKKHNNTQKSIVRHMRLQQRAASEVTLRVKALATKPAFQRLIYETFKTVETKNQLPQMSFNLHWNKVTNVLHENAQKISRSIKADKYKD